MMGNLAWLWLLYVGIMSLQCLYIVYGASCNNNADTGENDPKSKDNEIDTGSDMGVLLEADDNEYTFYCCGRISSWEIFAEYAGDVYLQVWRNTGATWELRGQNLYSVPNSEAHKEITITIPANDQILVDSGDVIGIYCPGNAIVTYKNEGGNGAGSQNHGYHLDYSIGSKTVGDTYGWSSQQVGRDYAINAYLSSPNSPSFSGHLTAVEFFDDLASGSLIKTVTATDADTLDVLTFSMTTTTSSFTFDTATLELRSSGNLPTSSTATSTTTISFRVTDDCGNTDNGQLEIKVKNNPPSITNLQSTAEVSEDETASTLLYTVSVTDNSPADTITCSVSNVSPTSSDFSMGVGSGGIAATGIYLNANPTLNYDVNKKYTLTITCSDSKESDSGEFIVFLTRNEAPSITNLPNGAMVAISTSTSSGDTIYQVTGSDPEGDTLYYSMTCDQSPCPFQLKPKSGNVKATSDLASYVLPAYNLYVYVYDNKTLVGPRTLTIIVTDINVAPAFTNIPLSSAVSVAENTALGTVIYQLISTDPNSQDIITYSAVFTPNSASGYFNFDGTTGRLTTALTLLNYEALSSTTITIACTVSDGKATDTQNLIINCINVNEAPQFDRASYSLSGDEGQAGDSVGAPGFVVTDPDTGDTLSYSIDCANFIMDSTTGAVAFSADYDTDSPGVSTTETCTVTVSDGSLTDTCQLFITINDKNDNTPTFTQPTYVFYTSATIGIGATLGTVSAPDSDTGAYGIVNYSLDQSNLTKEYFGVQFNGVVYVKEDISSFYSGHTLTIPVTATDTGGLTGTCNIIVVIPEYTTPSYTTSPERLLTFLEDTRNVAWIVVLSVTIVGMASFIIYVTYKACRCGDLCHWCNKSCCKQDEFHLGLHSGELASY